MVKKVLKKKKAKKKPTPEEKLFLKNQRLQRNEITSILKNIGFHRLPYIDGKHIEFKGRSSEMDDIFILKNIILITEYTIGSPGDHLLKKNYFYDRVNEDKREFIEFMLKEEKLSSFRQYYQDNIESNFSLNELQVRILYCSKQTISEEHKNLSKEVIFFDYNIVKYFQGLTKVIKRSSKYEFLEFLKVPFDQFGDNIISPQATSDKFSGHILPEERSSFKEGYKIVSFYIDAESLLKRAYVLRQNGWKDSENIGHYQRMFEAKKISLMRKYLTEKGRVFINNIISTISIDKIKLYNKE